MFDVSDNLFIIYDGTYARHPKSTKNEYQRKFFSGQKKVVLCKSFTICTTDRFVIDCDYAKILKNILNDWNGLCSFFEKRWLTAEESTQSRFVTKIRWSVESVHGILKQKYRLFDHEIDNKLLLKVGKYFRKSPW